jgi:hypothetical protein
MTKYLRWYLLLIFVASAGCTPVPTGVKDVLRLRVEIPLDETSITIKDGSAFAISDHIVITAMHVMETYGNVFLNGSEVKVIAVYPFGEDGLAVKVEALPPGTPRMPYSDNYGRGDILKACGYPDGLEYYSESGMCTAVNITTALFRGGMSGGPVSKNGVAVGLISATFPSLGVSRFEPLPIEMLKGLVNGTK